MFLFVNLPAKPMASRTAVKFAHFVVGAEVEHRPRGTTAPPLRRSNPGSETSAGCGRQVGDSPQSGGDAETVAVPKAVDLADLAVASGQAHGPTRGHALRRHLTGGGPSTE